MNRCRDYFGFAVWFAGIGYVVLWPLTAAGSGGAVFGAAIVCAHADGGIAAVLCALPHPMALPLGLHLLGLAAAMLVAVRLACRLFGRLRRRADVIPATALNARLPGAIPVRARKRQTRPLRTVAPRKHFGLRGVPR